MWGGSALLPCEEGFDATRRTPLAAGVAQNLVNLSLDILLVVALGVGVVGLQRTLHPCPT